MKIDPEILYDMLNSEQEWSPKTDIYETESDLVVKVDVSGLDPNDIELTLTKDESGLILKGCRNEGREEKIKYHNLEIYYGMIEHNILLPDSVCINRNQINAKYKDGMLTVHIAKKDKNKIISIKIED